MIAVATTMAVVGPFAEGVRSTFQPCTFLLIVPTITVVITARARWQALASALGAGIAGGWVLVDNRWILDGWTLRASALLVAALLVLLVVPRVRDGATRLGLPADRPWLDVATVGVVTFTATMWWRPCVGEELGAILNGAQRGLAAQFAPMAGYMVGSLIAVIVVVVVRHAAAPSDRLIVMAARVAAALGLVVAVSLVAGQHDDVVVTLTRWTLE